MSDVMTYEQLKLSGIRGDVRFTHEGNTYKGFVCHGCQSCWFMDPATDELSEAYPHFLSLDKE